MLLAKRIRSASRNAVNDKVNTDAVRRSSEPGDYPTGARNRNDLSYSSVSLSKRKPTLITVKKSSSSLSATEETERSGSRSPGRGQSRDSQNILNSWSGPLKSRALAAYK